MTFIGTLTAVLGANMLTAMFVYGLLQVTKEERSGREYSWFALGCCIFPLVMVLLGFFSVGHYPSWIGAIAAQ